MAYCTTNYKTKKALKEAVKAGKRVEVFQPGPFGGNIPENGTVSIEGPHGYHKWYARATLEKGCVVKVS